MKKVIYIVLAVLLGLEVNAQGVEDALRFSRMNYQGTARFNAMGGSFGALGGELSALMINPAGIGVYRNSEFTFSTALLNNSLESNFQNSLINQSTVNFNIPNIGFVNSYKGNPNGWKNYSFAIAHNRVNTLKAEYLFRGTNREGSSFLDPYVADLNDVFPNTDDLITYNAFPFGPAQAFQTFAIDTFRNNFGELYYDRWLLGEESIDQRKDVEQRGRQSETFFSFGGNFKDKFYLGGNLAVQSLRFEQEVVRTEEYNYSTPPPPGVTDINRYRESSSLLTLGTGFNFKLGMIYRITEALRIGAAFHSPTYYGMSEDFIMDSYSEFSDGNVYESDVVESNYDYNLRTPWRFNASLAYVLGNQGIINVDYEYVDYSTARFDDDRNFDYDYSFINNRISEVLTQTHNLRFGTEIRLDPFVLRGGFRYESNPYGDNTILNPDESRKTYSLGGGYRYKNFNFDLAYSLSQMDLVDPFYDSSPNSAVIQREDHLVTMSFGWKW